MLSTFPKLTQRTDRHLRNEVWLVDEERGFIKRTLERPQISARAGDMLPGIILELTLQSKFPKETSTTATIPSTLWMMTVMGSLSWLPSHTGCKPP